MASIIITKWPSSSVCRVGLGWELSDDQILQIPRLLICNPYPLTNNIIIIIIVNIIMIILGSRVIWKIFGSPDPWEGLVYLKWDFLTYSWTLWNTGCMETYLSEGILQFKQHVQMGWVKYQSARMGNSCTPLSELLLFLYFSNMVNRVSPKLLDLMKIFRFFGKFSNKNLWHKGQSSNLGPRGPLDS